MASPLALVAPQTCDSLSADSEMGKHATATSAHLPAKPSARPAAAAATADAWSIPAVQPRASECSDATSKTDCASGDACTFPEAEPFTPRLSFDLELSPDEAVWLVQPPALLDGSNPAAIPAPAPKQPATAAVPAAPHHVATAPLAALRRGLRRGLRRLAGGLRRRLAAAACMARPATLECGGCPGRRLGNASSGASAEWTVVHVNWT